MGDLEDEVARLSSLLESMQPSASHRRVGSEGEPQFPRSSHGQLDAYMETWEALLVAADQYGPLREAGEAITQVFCNDSERWYGEVLRFCKIVVSAMQANECKGIPEMFNPALCSCAGLDDVVTETLERADRYLAETGAAHPIHRRLAEEAEDLERRADKVAEKKLDTAGSISAVLKKMPRNNSLSSLGSFFGTETGSSLSGNSCQAFSMQSLRNSVKSMRPGLICKRALHEQRQKYIKDNRTSPVCTIRGMPASVAGDGGRTDSLIQELGSGMGSSPNSMSSEDHKFDENVATHRTRLNEWGRDNSEARQSDEVHAPTLTKVAENEIFDWLSQSATSRSTRGSRFETTDLFDVESARPQEAPGVDIGRHLQKRAPVIGCAVFLVVIATVLAVVFGLKLGQKDSGTQEALASPIPVPSVGVDNVSTTSSALPCKVSLSYFSVDTQEDLYQFLDGF